MPDRSSFRYFRLPAFVLAVLSMASIAMPAQTQSAGQDIRAARLTSVQGSVTVTDGSNTPVDAQVNLPLLSGTQVATGPDGQAEIEFEDGSVARLTPNSALSLDRLDVAPGEIFTSDLSLLHGLAYFELRATQDYVYTVNAGGDVLSPIENATVRIDFDQPPASFAVLDGTAQVQRTGYFQADVRTGETLRASGSSYTLTEQIADDSWDQWNSDMDQQAAQQSDDSTSVRDDYAGAQGYGWGDLDSSGTWYDVPGEGSVWQPYAAADSDFDPYGNGAWVYYPATGYVWASAYPWGWTPYRCGAWSYYNGFGWGWAPGTTCGGFGWGFAGGGFAVNIAVAPRGYRPVRVPIARPGPIRPVLPVRTTPIRPVQGRPGDRGPKTIAGVTAHPIAPVRTGSVTGNLHDGASLRRDFPIDRNTHKPAMGLAGTRPANVYRVGPTGNGQQGRSDSSRNARQSGTDQQVYGSRGDRQAPATTQSNLPQVIYGSGAGAVRSAPNSGQSQQGQQQPERRQGFQPRAPEQNSAPQQAAPTIAPRPQHMTPEERGTPEQNAQRQPQRPSYSAPPQQEQHTAPQHPNFATPPPQPRQNMPPATQTHPNYASPPPQQHQNYTPPPRYTPPPSAPQHFSPPPPPPHASAPPPATNSAPPRR